MKKVFTNKMFEELMEHMENVGWIESSTYDLGKDFSQRLIISEFLTDGTIERNA